MLEFFLFNLLVSIILYILNRKKEKKDALLWLLIMVTIPIGGLTLFIVFDNYKKFTSPEELEHEEFKEEEDSDFYSYVLTKPDLEKELNIIPIEDALILNDNITKRTLMIDALKGDTYQYIGILKKALKDPDTETSHYAATAVTEIKRKLMLSVQEMEDGYELNKENMEYLSSYIDVLEKYLDSGLLDDRATKKYTNIYSTILNKTLLINKNNEQNYEKKINCDIKMKKYNEAINCCDEYMFNFQQSDKPYILLMKIYYEQGNKTEFDIILEKLRNSKIKLNYNSLQIIRFWLEGV